MRYILNHFVFQSVIVTLYIFFGILNVLEGIPILKGDFSLFVLVSLFFLLYNSDIVETEEGKKILENKFDSFFKEAHEFAVTKETGL